MLPPPPPPTRKGGGEGCTLCFCGYMAGITWEVTFNVGASAATYFDEFIFLVRIGVYIPGLFFKKKKKDLIVSSGSLYFTSHSHSSSHLFFCTITQHMQYAISIWEVPIKKYLALSIAKGYKFESND